MVKSDGNSNPRVGVSMGITRNLGNFNSLKLDAWFDTPVSPDESPDDAFERVWAKVDEQLEKKLAEAGLDD